MEPVTDLSNLLQKALEHLVQAGPLHTRLERAELELLALGNVGGLPVDLQQKYTELLDRLEGADTLPEESASTLALDILNFTYEVDAN